MQPEYTDYSPSPAVATASPYIPVATNNQGDPPSPYYNVCMKLNIELCKYFLNNILIFIIMLRNGFNCIQKRIAYILSLTLFLCVVTASAIAYMASITRVSSLRHIGNLRKTV